MTPYELNRLASESCLQLDLALKVGMIDKQAAGYAMMEIIRRVDDGMDPTLFVVGRNTIIFTGGSYYPFLQGKGRGHRPAPFHRHAPDAPDLVTKPGEKFEPTGKPSLEEFMDQYWSYLIDCEIVEDCKSIVADLERDFKLKAVERG